MVGSPVVILVYVVLVLVSAEALVLLELPFFCPNTANLNPHIPTNNTTNIPNKHQKPNSAKPETTGKHLLAVKSDTIAQILMILW
jgi:hypothetical protein